MALVVAAFMLLAQAGASQTLPEEASEPLLDEWRWTHFTQASGLPSNHVLDFVEASDGVLWVATTEGLAWYDGYQWWPVAAAQEAPLIGIHAMVPRPGEGVYFVSGGHLYQGEPAGVTPIPGATPGAEDLIRSVAPGPAGSLWLAGPAGVLSFRNGMVRSTDLTDPYALVSGNASNAWAWSLGGLYHRRGGRWVNVDPEAPWDRAVLAVAGDRLLAVSYRSEESSIWEAGSDEPLQRIDFAGGGLPLMAAVSPQGRAVVGMTTGMRVRGPGGWRVLDRVPDAMANPTVMRFAKNGDLWVGSNKGLSVNRASSTRWKRWGAGTLPGAYALVNSILPVTRDSVWVGTAAGLAVRGPDGTTTRRAFIDGQRLGPITALARDTAGAVWIGSGSAFEGMYRWDGEWSYFDSSPFLGAAHVHRIVPDSRGRLWFLGIAEAVGLDEPGVAVLEDGVPSPWHPARELPSRRVFDMVEDASGALWFGTLDGVSRWRDGEWTHWGRAAGMRTGRAFALAADEVGRVWFGHGDAATGLGYIAGDSVHYPADQSRLDQVWDLVEGVDGAVWSGGSAGVARIGPDGVTVLGRDLGLGMDAVWPVVPGEHQVLVGTMGAGIFELSLAELEELPPRLIIEPRIGAEQVEITWLAFAQGGVASPVDVATRYRLGSEDWSTWGFARQIGPLSLRPGTYNFQVQARGVLGQTGPPASVSFRVPPPFFRHPIVLTLAGLWVASLLGVGLWYLRRRAALTAELRTREARYRQLFEGAPVGIARTDSESGRITACNERLAQILLYEDAAAVVANFSLAAHVRLDRSQRVAALKELAEFGRVDSLETEVERADGSLVWIRTSLHVHRQEGYTQAAVMEITKEKEAEAEQLRLAAQLQQAQKMEAVGQLTGGIAHDFNNILTVIHGSVGLLLQGRSEDPGRSRRLLEQAISAAQRGADLTRRLLAFSRKQALSPRTVDLGCAIADLMGLLQRTLGATVSIDLERPEALWPCEVDPTYFEAALLNLAINARDAMPLGGRLRLVVENVTCPGSAGCPPGTERGEFVRVSVSDNGVGMTPEVRAQAFDPFFTTKDVGKGSGLGLSMVHGFVSQSGGQIGIESELEAGTTLWFTLPRSGGTPAPRVADEVREEPRGSRQRILVVEDDAAVRALTTQILEHLDYVVEEAGSAAGALEILREAKPLDLLLTDVVLPGTTNGPELARLAMRLHPALKVLCMSGYTSGVNLEKAVNSDFPLVQKPFTTGELARRVHEILEGGEEVRRSKTRALG